MDKFTTHTGVAAPIMRNNVDTDAIIPSREMKTVEKTGLADGLFSAWRYLDQKSRQLNPDFVLNKREYADATILIGGNNFGCGSSREHAVWALKEYGIRAIIAETFGSIFFNNCVRNGILPIYMAREQLESLASVVASAPTENLVTIDLAAQTITVSSNSPISFEVGVSDKEMLLNGLDPIAVTQKMQTKIDAFKKADKERRTWMY